MVHWYGRYIDIYTGTGVVHIWLYGTYTVTVYGTYTVTVYGTGTVTVYGTGILMVDQNVTTVYFM